MMGQEPFRITPQGRSSDYVTYGFTMPKSTHQRKVTCAEFGCEAHRLGWVTKVPLGSAAAEYISSGRSGRAFVETTGIDGAEREFMFEAGQQCFREHFVNLDKDPVFYRKAGDWRTGGKLHAIEGNRWLDDFQQSTEQVRKNIENGS